MPGELKMKMRAPGQNAPSEVASRDLAAELREREQKLLGTKRTSVGTTGSGGAAGSSGSGSMVDEQAAAAVPTAKRMRLVPPTSVAEEDADDSDFDAKADAASADAAGTHRPATAAEDAQGKQAADHPAADSDGGIAKDSEEEEDESSDDEEAELMRELERIKAERAAEAERQAAMQREAAAAAHTEEVLRGNALLRGQDGLGAAAAAAADVTLRKRWDDDVVFRNQTRGRPEETKRFVNDTTRNDFHRKFMRKYVQ